MRDQNALQPHTGAVKHSWLPAGWGEMGSTKCEKSQNNYDTKRNLQSDASNEFKHKHSSKSTLLTSEALPTVIPSGLERSIISFSGSLLWTCSPSPLPAASLPLWGPLCTLVLIYERWSMSLCVDVTGETVHVVHAVPSSGKKTASPL